MLKSFEAIYTHGKLKWLGQVPSKEEEGKRVLVIVDVDKELVSEKKDIHKLLKQTRGIMGRGKTLEKIDQELSKLRSEWEREWDI